MRVFARTLIVGILLCMHFLPLISGEKPPKREFRGVWIATVMNIDWPSKQGLTSEAQQAEINSILDKQKALGMNAVILQIRSASDAIYPSALAPWSRYLSGIQGQAPNPFYDPLDYCITACHERGMEFHAWFNPYRVKQNMMDVLSPDNLIAQHPDWAWEYNNKFYMDPGHPEVRAYLRDVVLEVVNRYDIDAVHFDDYFYPYPAMGMFLPDTITFQNYRRNFDIEQIADWRRDNVNIFIQDMSLAIKKAKPWVKFGISPFGVWRNSDMDPMGSNTRAGITNYDHIYADVLKWQREGWIDYLMPQLYWHRGHTSADFTTLARWWDENSFERDVYIGHAVYRLNEMPKNRAWDSSDELTAQISAVRNARNLKGSAWFSSKQFDKETLGFKKELSTNVYQHPALVPDMAWINDEPPPTPGNLVLDRIKKRGKILSWDVDNAGMDEVNKARFFVVYRTSEKEEFDQDDSDQIHAIVGKPEIPIPSVFFLRKRKRYVYRISALDRLYNESSVSEELEIKE